jgi:hypothetical protein
MKSLIIAAASALMLATATAGPAGKMEEVRKPEATESVPATPKAMPKVKKPEDQRLIDCKLEANKEKSKCKAAADKKKK